MASALRFSTVVPTTVFLLVLAVAVPGVIADPASGISEVSISDTRVEDIEAGQESVSQHVEFRVAIGGSGTVRLTIDASGLPDGASLDDASVQGSWNTSIVSMTGDSVTIDVHAERPREAGIEALLTLNTDGATATDVTYVIRGGGSQDEATFRLEAPDFSDSTPFAEDVAVGKKNVKQSVTIRPRFEQPGSRTYTFDASRLQGGTTIEDVTVDSVWDASVIEVSDDRVRIEVDSGGSAGAANVTLTLTLNTEGALSDVVYYHVRADNTEFDVPFALGRIGIVSVVVKDGNGDRMPPEDVRVWAQQGSGSYTYGTPQEDGTTEISVTAGTYDIRATAEGYAIGTIEEVEVGSAREEPLVISLEEGAPITGTVTDEQGNPVEGATVDVYDAEGNTHQVDTDADGRYRTDVAPGEYTLRARQGDAMDVRDEPVTIESVDDEATVDFELATPAVVSADVEHVGGPRPEMGSIDVQTVGRGGLVFVQLTGEDAGGTIRQPVDLWDLGVRPDTEFEITLVVQNHEPMSLLWGARDLDWETAPSDAASDAVRVTIRTKPVHFEMIRGVPTGPTEAPASVAWPTGEDDVADSNARSAVQFGLFELSYLPPDAREAVRGMTATTNAQTFGFPQIDDGELSVYVGAPSERVDGEPHTGFYSVFVPDSLLEEWNVDDPETDLQAMYKGSEESFAVEPVDDGVWINIDPISYSDGTITIRSTAYEETASIPMPVVGVIAFVAAIAVVMLVRVVR